jgi:hypothetical protein
MGGRPENVADHDGAVRETNVYLVIFDEGICCVGFFWFSAFLPLND